MLELARRNQAEAGLGKAELLEGTMETIPLPDQPVDVRILTIGLTHFPGPEGHPRRVSGCSLEGTHS